MNTKKGFALIFTLIISLIIMIIIASLTAIASGDLTLAASTTDAIRAYNLAEAGLAKVFIERNANGEIIPGDIDFNTYTMVLSAGNTGTFKTHVTSPILGTYYLESTGKYKGKTKTISLTVTQTANSRYIYLTNSERRSGSPIWFIGVDVIKGPMHTNGQINILDDPTFEGPVSSAWDTVNYYHGPPPLDNPDFQSSLTLGAPNIQLPASVDIITPLRTAAQLSTGVYLNGASTVTLLSNGTMNVTNDGRHISGVTNAGQNWTNHNIPIPPNGSFFVDSGDVNISGILSGQLTVGTSNNIYVVNSILYNSDPRTHPTSTDLLGLVSSYNIYVDSSAPNNLEIDACILALNNSFLVENYDYGMKGTLTIYGGITQPVRGPVGTFDSRTGTKASGYTKNYNYDIRLQNSIPKYFPPSKEKDSYGNNRIVYSKTFPGWVEQ